MGFTKASSNAKEGFIVICYAGLNEWAITLNLQIRRDKTLRRARKPRGVIGEKQNVGSFAPRQALRPLLQDGGGGLYIWFSSPLKLYPYLILPDVAE